MSDAAKNNSSKPNNKNNNNSHSHIVIRGARVHNLKNVDVNIPRDQLVVITGLSGSGKSSLAFDTIYAEGQRRYVESLSAYARQFLGLMDKPDADRIEGLSPAISIDQKSATKNPRSTVGTVTEIYDHLRLLFARVGYPHCPKCGRPVARQSVTQITNHILELPKDTKVAILAPLVRDRKGEHKDVLSSAEKAGFVRMRIDGIIMEIAEAKGKTLDKKKKHTIEAVVDRLVIDDEEDRPRMADSVETALKHGEGLITVLEIDSGKEHVFSERFACENCRINLPEIEPRSFSFNSPHGACPRCTGLGTQLEVNPDLVIPNKDLSLAEGAIRPWSKSASQMTWYQRMLMAVAKKYKFSLNVPVRKLPKEVIRKVMYGTDGETIVVKSLSGGRHVEWETAFEGVVHNLERRYKETDSDFVRSEIERYMIIKPCPVCEGKRLRPESLAVKVVDKTIDQVVEMTVQDEIDWVSELQKGEGLNSGEQKISKPILKEMANRLGFLVDVGLDYLTIDRSAATLAGGESQRIRLATQIGSQLVGVVYILDEPSIGLHQRDNERLIKTLKHLRNLGNTVLVVEHDEETIREADHVIDIGPGAGEQGGEVVAEGDARRIAKVKSSLTGMYLSGKRQIESPKTYRRGNGKSLEIKKAAEHNLKNIDAKIPLGKFVCITGVSGSGKSTLMNDILARALAQKFHNAKALPGKHQAITGLQHLDKMILIDQSPIGRTPRSNPATYTGVFNYIRDLFAATEEARLRGYKAGRFSFNVKGGRCETCRGDGVIKIEMQFLPDVYVECEDCHGRRYNSEALEVEYKGMTIAEVLDMTAEKALKFFRNIPALNQRLQTLVDVGLGYIHLGQPATTLSGGEAQRIKLSTELSRRATGKTLYILDEPTTGLHFDDVKKLLAVLNQLVDKGNTVLVIEHNLDMIKSADWVLDLGPEGGEGGGTIVSEGTPRQVVKAKKSFTGGYLAKALEK